MYSKIIFFSSHISYHSSQNNKPTYQSCLTSPPTILSPGFKICSVENSVAIFSWAVAEGSKGRTWIVAAAMWAVMASEWDFQVTWGLLKAPSALCRCYVRYYNLHTGYHAIYGGFHRHYGGYCRRRVGLVGNMWAVTTSAWNVQALSRLWKPPWGLLQALWGLSWTPSGFTGAVWADTCTVGVLQAPGGLVRIYVGRCSLH